MWTALDANHRLMVCFRVGGRTLEECRVFPKDLSSWLISKPLLVSVELPHYADAILEACHKVETLGGPASGGAPWG